MIQKPYPEYKDSGAEWLGKVPEAWHIKRISWLFKVISSGTTPPNEKHEYYDGEFNWVTTGELRERGILETRRTVTSEALATYSALRVYPSGTLLIAMYGATIGRLGFLDAPATTNQACCAFAEPIETIPRYIFYVFLAAREHLLVIADGGGQPNINQDKLRSLRVPHPTFQEQEAISDYLDRETAEIDAFIADQEKLIALLGERRTATLTQAVTKGLNPDAPIKDSGIAWIGEIPEHWTVSRFSRCVRINSGQVDPKDPLFSDMYLIAPNHVESATGRLIGLETASSQGADSGKYLVRAGQIIYSKIRPNLMKTVVAPVNCLCSADMYGLEADRSQLSNKFLMYLLLSRPFHDYAVDQSMRVAMPKLNHDSLGAAPVWLPPQLEQEQIVKFIETELPEIDAAIAEAREAIALSKERRSAVISAAVTGKIDVRGLASPAATEMECDSVVLGA